VHITSFSLHEAPNAALTNSRLVGRGLARGRPGEGAKRRDKGLDVVGTAIPGGGAARNDLHHLPGRDVQMKNGRQFPVK